MRIYTGFPSNHSAQLEMIHDVHGADLSYSKRRLRKSKGKLGMRRILSTPISAISDSLGPDAVLC